MKIYHYVEFVLILLLVLRILYFLRLDRTMLFKHLELLIYFFVLFLNSLTHELGFNGIFINRLYNALLPVSLIVSISFDKLKKPIFIMFTTGFFVIFIFKISYEKIVSILYVISTCMVIMKAINMTRKSSKLLKVSPVYFVIALDLIFTLISVELSQFKVNWSLSKYANYVQSISLIVFFVNVVIYHVYIRRFFVV